MKRSPGQIVLIILTFVCTFSFLAAVGKWLANKSSVAGFQSPIAEAIHPFTFYVVRSLARVTPSEACWPIALLVVALLLTARSLCCRVVVPRSSIASSCSRC